LAFWFDGRREPPEREGVTGEIVVTDHKSQTEKDSGRERLTEIGRRFTPEFAEFA
jgi:hypothetical protein